MLEPYAMKVACTVLKGLGVENDLRLLDYYLVKKQKSGQNIQNIHILHINFYEYFTCMPSVLLNL
jgi:hypothetical protein